MAGETLERARHRWREILPQLGIETRFLTNKHGPCPLCGGKDRYRFDDKDGSGSYYCHQCGAGIGLLLVRKKNGWSFKEACDQIDKIVGQGPPQPPQAEAPKADAKARRAAIERLLAEANSPDIVEGYLRRRGLSVTSDVLRGHWQCPYFDENGLVGKHRAIIAPVHAADGSLVAAQRIYDAQVDPRKKLMPSAGTVTGAAVRLFEITDGRLGIAEGVETALAVHQLDGGIPTWAALSAHGLETFVPPPKAQCIFIYADNDLNHVGQCAAHRLAGRLHKAGLTVGGVLTPSMPGTDWLDFINKTPGAPSR
jgi:putative DNA primase/helicase